MYNGQEFIEFFNIFIQKIVKFKNMNSLKNVEISDI